MKTVRFGLFFFTLVAVSFALSASTSQVLQAYGLTTAGPPSNPSGPTCDNSAPKAPGSFSAKVSGSNAVELSWAKVDNATSWTIAYGSKSGTYVWGAASYGNSETRSLKVGSLPAGRYYFAVRANNGCMPGPFSSEVQATIGGGSGVGTSQPVTKVNTLMNNVTYEPQPVQQFSPTGIPTQTVEKLNYQKQGTNGQAPVQPAQVKNLSVWEKIVNFFTGIFKR